MPCDLCNCYNLQLCSAYSWLKGLKNLSAASSFHSLKVVFMQHQQKRARLPYNSLSLWASNNKHCKIYKVISWHLEWHVKLLHLHPTLKELYNIPHHKTMSYSCSYTKLFLYFTQLLLYRYVIQVIWCACEKSYLFYFTIDYLQYYITLRIKTQ